MGARGNATRQLGAMTRQNAKRVRQRRKGRPNRQPLTVKTCQRERFFVRKALADTKSATRIRPLDGNPASRDAAAKGRVRPAARSRASHRAAPPPAPHARRTARTPRPCAVPVRGGWGAEFANSPKLTFPQMQKGQPRTTDLQVLVGLTGFEPAASASRTQRSTKLSHNPKYCFKQRRI